MMIMVFFKPEADSTNANMIIPIRYKKRSYNLFHLVI